jgi:excisionase family DNA binding protein
MELLSTQEVAKVLGIHESTVRLWATKGNMPFKAIKIGKLWKFQKADVMQYRYGTDYDPNEVGFNNENSGNTASSID